MSTSGMMSLGATAYSGTAPQQQPPASKHLLLGADLSGSRSSTPRRHTPPPPIVVSSSTSSNRQLPSAHSIDDDMQALLRDAGVTQREIRIRRKKVPSSPRRSTPSPSRSPAPPSPRELLPYERDDDSPKPPSSASSRNSAVWPSTGASPPVSPKRASMIRRKPAPLLDEAEASVTPPPRSPTHTPPVLLSVPGPGMAAVALLPSGPGSIKRARPAPFAAFSPPPPPADEPDAPYSPITVRPASWQRPQRTFSEVDDGSAPKSAPATIARRGHNTMEAVHEVDARVTVPPTPPPEPVTVLQEAAALPLPRAEPSLPRSETMPARPPLSSADSTNSIKSLPEWLAAKPVRSGSGDASRSHLPRSASISSKLAIVVPPVPEEPMPASLSVITSPREASPVTTPVAPASPTFGTVTVSEPEPMPVPVPVTAPTPTRGPRSPLRVTGLPHGAKRLSGSSLDGEHTDSEYFSEVSEQPAAVPAPGSTVSALDSEIRTPTGATFHSGTVDEDPGTVRRGYRVSRVETEPSTSDEEADEEEDEEEYASAEDHLHVPVARVDMPVPRPLASPATVRSEPVGDHVRAAAAGGVPKPRSFEDAAVAGTLHPGALPARKVSLANLPPTSSSTRDKTKASSSSRSGTRRAPTATHGLDYEAFEDEYPSDGSVEPKQSGKPKSEPFSVFRAPSARTLWEASQKTVTDDEGRKVAFGDLFPSYDGGAQKTVMVFVRHFWCGACQNYMEFSLSNVDPEIVRQHNIRVVLIGCGSWKAIKAYKALFNCQYEMYTDRSRKIYKLMGLKMPKRKDNAPKTRGAYNQPVWTQATTGIKRGFKHMRHVPGDFVQLGGEFVLAPGYKAEFTHRMSTPANHMEFIDVLRHAGIPDHAFEAAAKAALMPARIPSMASTTASMGASTLDRALEQLEAERADSSASCAMPGLDDDDDDDSDADTETEENEHELNRRFEEAMAHEQALAAKQARAGATGAPRSPPPPQARASQVGLAL